VAWSDAAEARSPASVTAAPSDSFAAGSVRTPVSLWSSWFAISEVAVSASLDCCRFVTET
jgi:hypothetical protein